MAEITSRIMTLPTLALRGMSVFPGTVMQFDVERPMSIAALNAAIGTDRQIFLVAQKDITCDSPRQEDLYSVGTVCRLSQILRTSSAGGRIRCIVDGVYRARLLRITTEAPALWANVQVLTDAVCDPDGLEITALVRLANDLFAEYASVSGALGPEILLKLAGRKEPGYVSDYISQHIFLQPILKQELLEETDPVLRLNNLCEMLRREIQIMGLQQELAESTNEQLAKNQRDYFLREQLHVIQNELGEGDTDDIEEYRESIRALHLGEDVEKKLLKEVSRLQKQPFGSAEGAVIRGYLDTVLELPWNIRTNEISRIDRAKKILDEDHYGLTKVKDRILEYLAVRQMAPEVKGGVLCLVGPPGVGKTSIAMSVARATNRKLARVSLGGVHDEAEIRGHRKTYIGAMPGRIITGIQQAGSMNPVLVLDELDKLGSDYKGDPSAALLEALDTAQNSTFRDHFLEIPFDLSEVLFITTANTTDTIPRALLDRMEIIQLGSYTDEEKLHIARDHLLPRQRKKHGLTGHQLRISDEAMRDVISLYTKESGVRQLEREIAAICRRTVRGIAEGQWKSLTVRSHELETYLGSIKYKPENTYRGASVGLVHGLAWTSVGGTVLDVECAALPGTGKLCLTGNLGDVMKESCQAALSYIRSRTEVLGIAPDFYEKTDIHLHFPEGAVPKDGPSAGIAVCLCMISAITGRSVRSDIAMTGEITLRGRVMAIGGIQEKSMGALRAGIHEILLPEDNVTDLSEIDPDVRAAINYTAVSHMDAVLEKALCPEVEAKPLAIACTVPSIPADKPSTGVSITQ